MKFTWFNLMPWPYLPDDFRAQHRSVWVDIPNTLYDPRKGHHVYHEYLDQLEYAETLGFDGIGCNEHHQNGYGLMPSPNLIAATLARRTSRAALCVIGNSIASYNPPIRVAEEFGMLDVISGGRLVAGFPVGTPMDTNFCYGQIPALPRGKDESPYRAAFAQIICVADSDAEAERLYAEHCLYFFNRCLHVFPPFADPAGYRTMATIKYGALAQLTLARQKILENLTWKQLVDERFIIAGSPETVRQQLEECIKGLHVGHLFCLFHNGDMPDWKTRHSSKLFAEKVMPHLRDMWPDWKHDERWWMHPMDDRIRPEERQPGANKIGAAWPR